jgi:hypothetical protein
MSGIGPSRLPADGSFRTIPTVDRPLASRVEVLWPAIDPAIQLQTWKHSGPSVLGPLHQTSALGVNADALVAHQAQPPRSAHSRQMSIFSAISIASSTLLPLGASKRLTLRQLSDQFCRRMVGARRE